MFPTPEILAWLHRLADAAARWGAILPVAILFAVALVEALVLPRRYRAKAAWIFAVVLCGLGAAGLLRWEARQAIATATIPVAPPPAADNHGAETMALHALWVMLDGLSKQLPPPPSAEPPPTFATRDDAIAALSAKIVSLKEQVAAVRSGTAGRAIDPQTGAKLADFLRQYGSFRVVVSCVPNDDEAYAYANRLVDILKAAGWDANGPEPTADLGRGPAMGVSVLVRDPTAPGAAKVLLAAFDRFDIAHQPAIGDDTAIPDAATVELYVAQKP